MPTSKKRRLSGLNSLDLDNALTLLRKLRSLVPVGGFPELESTGEDKLEDRLDRVIDTLESRANAPLSRSFLNTDEKSLAKFNVTRMGTVYLRSDFPEAIIASRTLGSDQLWSNDHMYKHLNILLNSLTYLNEACSRAVIDTFFFRSMAMVPSSMKMILMQENPLTPVRSSMDTSTGLINYTAVFAELSIANDCIVTPPTLNKQNGQQLILFFAAEAKSCVDTVILLDHLPRVVLELVACAKDLGKSHVRGALTTGFLWHFIVVEVDADGSAKFWKSEPITWAWKTDMGSPARKRCVGETSDEYDPALIAGILSSWISESFTQFEGDQWFYRIPKE